MADLAGQGVDDQDQPVDEFNKIIFIFIFNLIIKLNQRQFYHCN